MNYFSKRHSTYCHRVDRYINYEIVISLSNGQLQCTATCTGIEDSCEDCPLVIFNDERSFHMYITE